MNTGGRHIRIIHFNKVHIKMFKEKYVQSKGKRC